MKKVILILAAMLTFAACTKEGDVISFKTVKPGATVYPVDENANSDVEAVIDEYDDFVFLNGNTCAEALSMLKAKGKNVYAFDAYEEFNKVYNSFTLF